MARKSSRHSTGRFCFKQRGDGSADSSPLVGISAFSYSWLADQGILGRQSRRRIFGKSADRPNALA